MGTRTGWSLRAVVQSYASGRSAALMTVLNLGVHCSWLTVPHD